MVSSSGTLEADTTISHRVLADIANVRFALNRPKASPQQIMATHGACLQSGLAKLWLVVSALLHSCDAHVAYYRESFVYIRHSEHVHRSAEQACVCQGHAQALCIKDYRLETRD